MKRKIDPNGEPDFSGIMAAVAIGLAIFVVLSVVSFVIAEMILEAIGLWP